MSKFKVTLEFHYDSDEDISDWNIDSKVKAVTNADEAIEVAQAELAANSVYEFTMSVYDENNEFIKNS